MNHIVCTPRGGWTVVTFESDRLTDPVALHYLEQELTAALAALPGGARVVVCLEGVDYVSSQVAGLLLGAKKLVVAGRRGRFVLCRVGDHLAEMLRMTKLESQFEIKPRLRDVLGNDAPRIKVKPRELVGATSSRPPRGGEPQWID